MVCFARMNILLLKPVSETHIISPTIGLGYLATALRTAGWQPQLLDCTLAGLDWDGLRRELQERKPDILGIQMWSCDFPAVQRTLALCKELLPHCVTIVGGAHPTGDPDQVLRQLPDADFAFRGEGERGFPRFVRGIATGDRSDFPDIPGLIWRNAAGQPVANLQEYYANLDEFDMPAWDLIDPRRFPEAPHQGFAKAFPNAPLIISRGCPFDCTFCATKLLAGRKIRYRSLDLVMREIRLLRETYGVKEIHIEDDNLTMNRAYVRAFCERLLAEEPGLWWHCSSGVRLDSLDLDTLQLMKRAGCYTLTIAIESGVQRVLDHMKKRTTLEEIRKGVDLVNAAGFEPTGLFILGYPIETLADMHETIRFSLELKLKRAQYAIFHPQPGSEAYDVLVHSGELREIDWSKIKPTSVAYTPKGITPKQLKNLQIYAMLRFHLRPRIVLKQFAEIQSPRHFLFILKRVWDYLVKK